MGFRTTVVALLAWNTFAQAFDAISTLVLLRRGAQELNPVMNALISASPIAFAVFKILILPFFLAYLAWYEYTRGRLFGLIAVSAVYLALVSYHSYLFLFYY